MEEKKENSLERVAKDGSLAIDSKGELKGALVRGALKIDVTTSTNLVSAGKEFSIYVVIHNPFDVPITLHRTETHMPVELSDEISKSRRRKEVLDKRDEELKRVASYWGRSILRLRYLIQDFNIFKKSDTSSRVAEAVGVEYDRLQRETRQTIIAPTESDIKVDRDLIAGDQWNLEFDGMSKDEVRQILWDIEQYIQGKSPIILQPGNSVVTHFVLKTTKWLLFSPLAHKFQIQVTYDVEGKYQTDTIPYAVNIQASMFSALVGAVFGSLLGSFVRTPPSAASTSEIVRTMLTSSIFAIIIVVAFARKSNVQQIVSVEDFWGGVFIGFLAGYTGESFISAILGNPS